MPRRGTTTICTTGTQWNIPIGDSYRGDLSPEASGQADAEACPETSGEDFSIPAPTLAATLINDCCRPPASRRLFDRHGDRDRRTQGRGFVGLKKQSSRAGSSLHVNPGAAALTRLGGGTGFRWDEAVFSSRNAAPLNINVTDTYHVGIGDPVGRRKAVVFEYDRMRLEA